MTSPTLPIKQIRQTCAIDEATILSFVEFGTASGTPVFYFHGLPSSCFEAGSWQKTALEVDCRIIAIDRPGIGASTHLPARCIVDFPRQIATLANHLQLSGISVIGVSGGAPYALACAAYKDVLPDLRAVAVLGGLGPRDLSTAGMSFFQKVAYTAIDVLPGGVIGWFWNQAIGKATRNPDRSVLQHKMKQSLLAQGPEEKAVAEDEYSLASQTEALCGAFVQGSDGYVVDASLISKPWGFSLRDITGVPVGLWYGGKDGLAPVGMGRAISEQVTGSTLFCYDKDGHYGVTLGRQAEVLSWLTKFNAA